jgi:hypothetical protein
MDTLDDVIDRRAQMQASPKGRSAILALNAASHGMSVTADGEPLIESIILSKAPTILITSPSAGELMTKGEHQSDAQRFAITPSNSTDCIYSSRKLSADDILLE